jgi:Rod binding domain-containing protein
MNAASPISALQGSLAQGSGVSPVTSASEPAAVREGSPKAKQAYETARNFEAVLMQQLSQQLVKSSGLEGEGGGSTGGEEEGGAQESSSAGGSGTLSSFLPQVLTEALMRGGTLGIANQLTLALDPSAAEPKSASGASSSVTASGGSEA